MCPQQCVLVYQGLNIIRSVLLIEPTGSLFTQPAKRTDEFSNCTCEFIRLMCLALSLNKNFQATLTTHDIHCISVFKNQGVHRGNHRNEQFNFQKLAQIFVGLQLKIFKPREFSQFNPWVDNRATCMFKILCILADIEPNLFTRTHM